ncbi:MAG TPA: NAD(P)/FAD-dependent oxidoreductase [Ohtaekwangia sp.]|uniref:flavin monoamine oxidase family protein n=1 Tax=Ohtaekwangia sp. TaxID=2066019 RepID=UPI002F952507
MKRREALQHIGLGVSAGLIFPAWLSSCKSDDPKPEITYDGVVGVIGAGAAGLHVADILRSKGIPVRIFEASDRIGGRVRSLQRLTQPSTALLFDPDNLPTSTYPTELGAQFVLGADSAWGKIISQLNVQMVEFGTLGSESYFVDGTIKTAADLAGDADFIAAQNFVTNLASNTSTGSVQQAIAGAAINSRMYAILNSWIGNRLGTSDDQLGAKAVAEALALQTRNNQQFVLKSNLMEDALLSRFSNVIPYVEVNSVVKSVNYSGDKIVVSGDTTGAGSFTAEVDRLIVTVPVSILKSGLIAFSPALPSAKTTALSRMAMDASIRVRLEFKKNFWGANSTYIYGGTQAPQYYNAGLGRDDAHKTLDITIQGPKAAELSAKGKDMVLVILAELDAVFNGQATENVRRDGQNNILYVIMDWSKEPYIGGGTAYIKAGGSNQDKLDLAEAIDKKLFFAGEATDNAGEYGTISGALQSAERASQEVVDSIVTV